jgi:two-component sensor histidine kinase/CheY-like chemotaxis protein
LLIRERIMPTPLRVLFLEDREPDAELLLYELRKAGYEPDWRRVDTPVEYLARLDSSLDVILADYSLPQFNALGALELLKERGLDIPFIVVTGTVSEEAAVECMRQGATDYLLKDRLGRLGSAIQQALQQKFMRDDKRRADELIKASLEEKKVLLRELYHRTKNNMQVISSMLSLQSAALSDDRVAIAFQEMRNRIHSMSLIHEKLYQSHNLSSIDMGEYIAELIKLVLESYGVSPVRITHELDTEDVPVTLDVAVPCGLIINELISNSIKHAFPGDRLGKIRICFGRRSDDALELTVADDGIGVGSGFDLRTDAKLGLQTVVSLVENQLQGQVEFDVREGVTCRVRFKDISSARRV